MLGKKRHAGWIFVQGLVLSVVGLFAIEMSLPLSDSIHRAVEMLIVMIAYTLYLLWEQKNSRSIQLDEQQRFQETAHLAIGPLQVKPVMEHQKVFGKKLGALNGPGKTIQTLVLNKLPASSAVHLITLTLVSLGSLVSSFFQDLLR